MASLKDITQNKKFPWMATIGAIGAIGAALIALNTFTGLNLRPAWGFEIEALSAESKQVQEAITAESQRVQEMLNKATEERTSVGKAVLDLKRGQLQLRVRQIQDEQRVLRRELTRHRLQAEEFRQREETVPGWLSDSISDTESSIDGLETEKGLAQDRLLEITE